MKIGFLNNQLDNRGTGNAAFNYAHFNEVILGNSSVIYTFSGTNHSKEAVEKFVDRFQKIYTPTPENIKGLDALYHIKSGEIDGFDPISVPYLVHAVFNPVVHGTRFAVVSEWAGLKNSLPWVPHIVELDPTSIDLRQYLKIPDDAIVFGRHGGYDSFDISFVWEAIEEVLAQRDNIYFLFLNTQPHTEHERVRYFPSTLNEGAKRAFLNTCNAMLHARSRGETFGISVGEFAVLGKPVFTYGNSYEKAHIYELKGTARTYHDKEELVKLLLDYNGEKNHPFYDHFTPEQVMRKFKEVFLDGLYGSSDVETDHVKERSILTPS